MEQKQFDHCLRRLKCRWPIIGGWLRGKAARRLTEDNSARAIGALARASVETKDKRLRRLARQALEAVSQPASVVAVCEVWAQKRQADLASLITARQWVVTAPPRLRVLTALLCAREERLCGGSPEIVAPLVEAASDADPEIARRARQALPRLKKPEAIDEFCRLWTETRAPLLEEVLQQAGYVARHPPKVRVLLALRVDQGSQLLADGPEVAEPLAAACGDANSDIAARARAALSSLANADTRDALCRLVVDRNLPVAQEVALAKGWVPRDELLRALFFLLTDQWERYDELDFDRMLLRTGFGAAPADLRQRILTRLRAGGRADLLTRAVGLGETRGAAGTLPEEELRSVIALLEQHQEWAKLWTLAFETPLVWSARLVRRLGEAGWQPEREDARETFVQLRELLTQGLPEQPESLAALLPPAVCLAHARVKGNVNTVAFAPERPVIAIGTGHRRLALWNFQQGKLEWTRSGFEHSIGRVAFGSDGLLLCGERTNGQDSCGIHICREGEVRRFAEHTGSVTGLEAVEGGLFLSSGRDQRVILWDLGSQHPVTSMDLGFWARGLKLAPDHKRVALVHSGVAVLNLPSLEMFQDGDDAFAGVARCVCFSPDGTAIIAGKVNSKVLALPLDGSAHRRAKPVLLDHIAEITGLSSLPGRSVLLSGDASGRIRFTSWPQQSRVGDAVAQGQRLTSLHVSDDEAFMVTGDSEEKIAFWDIRGLELPVLLSRPLATATPTHLGVATSFRQAKELPAQARTALAFLEILLRFRFRYDIEINDIAGIQPGEFDIEIEG